MNKKIEALLSNLRRDERGLTTVEYVIVLCLIAAISVGVWQKFGKAFHDHLDTASGDIETELNKGE